MKQLASHSMMNQVPWISPFTLNEGNPSPALCQRDPMGDDMTYSLGDTYISRGDVRHMNFGIPPVSEYLNAAAFQKQTASGKDIRQASHIARRENVACNARSESSGHMPASEYPEGSDLRQGRCL